MSEYVPPCELEEGDFEFTCKVTDVDDETGDVSYAVIKDVRCDTCFLLEHCLQTAIASIYDDGEEVPMTPIEEDGTEMTIN